MGLDGCVRFEQACFAKVAEVNKENPNYREQQRDEVIHDLRQSHGVLRSRE